MRSVDNLPGATVVSAATIVGRNLFLCGSRPTAGFFGGAFGIPPGEESRNDSGESRAGVSHRVDGADKGGGEQSADLLEWSVCSEKGQGDQIGGKQTCQAPAMPTLGKGQNNCGPCNSE